MDWIHTLPSSFGQLMREWLVGFKNLGAGIVSSVLKKIEMSTLFNHQIGSATEVEKYYINSIQYIYTVHICRSVAKDPKV